MLARLRSQVVLHQRRSVGSSRKLPKNKPLVHEPPVLTRPSLTSEAEQPERPKDFRSPWLFKAVGVGNFIIIPVIGTYAAFYWDWGDDGRENVMQPHKKTLSLTSPRQSNNWRRPGCRYLRSTVQNPPLAADPDFPRLACPRAFSSLSSW
ncbi:hypothetical protein B0H11DRAFT_2016617 [Mycena galericulata]|nr:hypothetical protein B0H11DRAFT_2016617 [Mycena galericulata]